MKSRSSLPYGLIAALLLTACSALDIPTSQPQNPGPEPIYQSVEITQVEIEMGVGSPIPINAIISGNLPDSCAQLELIQHRQEAARIQLWLASIPSSADGCVQDTLPFRITIPLNPVNLPAGTYQVEVNGRTESFDLETGNSTSTLPSADSSIRKEDVVVDRVDIESGVGSPIPVHAVASLRLPNTCAQLGEVRLAREANTFHIWLIADIADREDCSADSIPFLARIPLNIVNLPEGSYVVDINGTTASFDPRTVPAATTETQAFENLLMAAVTAKNIHEMKSLMQEDFIVAYWRSESVTYPAPEAAAQLAENYLPSSSAPTFHSFEAVPGFDLAAMAGPEVELVSTLHATGLGADADSEALLLIARRADGSLYWHSILITHDGFV